MYGQLPSTVSNLDRRVAEKAEKRAVAGLTCSAFP